MALLKKFDDSYQYNGESYTEPEKNYVLIIDEINRANLSSVLGELIYALEYRGEKVESMYDADGKDLILPPNLYIIGTMNTADRSVGHIDYAIRRRFAFVDVPPERLQDNDEIYFNSTGYDQVKALFNENNVSKEFDIKDVQIGHSYFIAKKEEEKELQDRDAIFKLKMNYEVVPILLELKIISSTILK
jgi:5-methylcytosine-specific restriction endonuclease McrBC GTP-binding regulatory subunit McrB